MQSIDRKIKQQVEDVTIPVGQSQQEVTVTLDSNYKRCNGYGISHPLDPTARLNTTEYFVSLQDNLEVIQDRVQGSYLAHTPNVPVSERLVKADFSSSNRTFRIKVDTNGVAVTGTPFVVRLVFQLEK